MKRGCTPRNLLFMRVFAENCPDLVKVQQAVSLTTLPTPNFCHMRLFFLAYRDRLPPKRQMPSGKLIGEKSQTVSGESALAAGTDHPDQQQHFQLSWSQYVFLPSIAGPNEWNFYEIESTTDGWLFIHPSQYQLYLPSKEDLKQRLMERAGEENEQ